MPDNWITTKGGDRGETSLGDGTRVPKDSPRVELYGTLDECQAHIGMARATCSYTEICQEICFLEQVLSPLMGYIALFPGLDLPDIGMLEQEIEKVIEITGNTLRFVRPGDSVSGAALHAARTVGRRAERIATGLYRDGKLDDKCYTYINRLSDAIYAISLWIDYVERKGEESSRE